MALVLLVEDDPGIAEPLSRALGRDGHEVDVAVDGRSALESFDRRRPDVIVLDLGLPEIDGVEVCRRIRRVDPAVPIIMLTARAEELDAIIGLDAGADDYVTKPFRLAELLARVRAQLRGRGGADGAIVVGAVRVDVEARRAFAGERELVLTPKEFDLLHLLAREAGTVVTRERIMAEVWDEHW